QIIWSGYVTELEEIIDLLSKAGESIGRTTGINLAITTYNQQMTTKIMGLNKFLDEWVSNQDVLAQESYERAMAVERNVSLLQMVLIVVAIVMAILVGWLVAQSIVRPLRAVVHTAEALAQGQLNERVNLKQKDEMGMLAA